MIDIASLEKIGILLAFDVVYCVFLQKQYCHVPVHKEGISWIVIRFSDMSSTRISIPQYYRLVSGGDLKNLLLKHTATPLPCCIGIAA